MNRIASRRPDPGEATRDYQRNLIDQLPGDCALSVLEDQRAWVGELTSLLGTEQVDKIHSPYGWTIRQVFEHCVDAERVFGYRILRLSAGDSTPLPGWNENEYADSRFGLGSFGGLIGELDCLRQANLLLLRRIIPPAWNLAAEVDGDRMTVRAIAWLTAGHLHHHLAIVENRCGVSVPRTRQAQTMDD